jgi:hypothetical protein
MEKMDLSLTPRAEGVREPQRSISPVHFGLAEIKKHFDESLNGIKKQGETAAKFLKSGQEEEYQDIWRSQVVFLEGILPFFCMKSANMHSSRCFLENGKRVINILESKCRWEK